MENLQNQLLDQQLSKGHTKQQNIPLHHQVIVLFLGMFCCISYPYCFDIPQALQTQLQEIPYSLNPWYFNLLYVCLSLPNIILNPIGAIITTNLGTSKAIIMYSFLMVIASGIIFYSIYAISNDWYALLLLGRILLGFSGWSITGANLTIISKYSETKYRALFVGLASILPWTAQSMTSVISPIIYQKTNLIWLPFLVGLFFTSFSLICSILLFAQDNYLQKKLKTAIEQQTIKKFEFKSIKKLGPMMIVIFFIIFFAVSIEGSIIINANDMLHQRVGFSNVEAGTIVMTTLIINIFASPCWAYTKEKLTNKRILFPVIGIILFSDLITLFYLPQNVTALSYFLAYLGFILLGIWDGGAVTVIVGSIPQILPQQLHSLGFSVYTTALAAGNGINPLVTGYIIKHSENNMKGYKNCYYLYFGLFIIVSILICYIWLTKNPQACLIDQHKSEEESKKLNKV